MMVEMQQAYYPVKRKRFISFRTLSSEEEIALFNFGKSKLKHNNFAQKRHIITSQLEQQRGVEDSINCKS